MVWLPKYGGGELSDRASGWMWLQLGRPSLGEAQPRYCFRSRDNLSLSSNYPSCKCLCVIKTGDRAFSSWGGATRKKWFGQYEEMDSQWVGRTYDTLGTKGRISQRNVFLAQMPNCREYHHEQNHQKYTSYSDLKQIAIRVTASDRSGFDLSLTAWDGPNYSNNEKNKLELQH